MTAVFIKSAASSAQFPADDGREVAFVGRSNSGKSTALNAITGVRGLARVSKTPGRTQLVNFFHCRAGQRLVDLPGYGFAHVPAAVRGGWRELVESYFRRRRSLAGAVVTIDIRRGLTALDEQLLAWLAARELPVALLLTKADKLSFSAGLTRCREIAARAGQGVAVTRFSAPSGEGVEEIRTWVASRLEAATDASGAIDAQK